MGGLRTCPRSHGPEWRGQNLRLGCLFPGSAPWTAVGSQQSSGKHTSSATGTNSVVGPQHGNGGVSSWAESWGVRSHLNCVPPVPCPSIPVCPMCVSSARVTLCIFLSVAALHPRAPFQDAPSRWLLLVHLCTTPMCQCHFPVSPLMPRPSAPAFHPRIYQCTEGSVPPLQHTCILSQHASLPSP